MEAGADVCMHSFEVEVEVVNDMFFYSGRAGLSDHVVLYIVACNVPRNGDESEQCNIRTNNFHTENEVPSSLKKRERDFNQGASFVNVKDTSATGSALKRVFTTYQVSPPKSLRTHSTATTYGMSAHQP